VSRRRVILAGALAALAAAPVAHGASIADRTLRVSLGVNGTEGDGDARHAAMSGDGRLAAFDSDAANLSLDPNGAIRDVFVRDIDGNVTGLVSRAPGGPPADGPSTYPALSGDGAQIAFISGATNLVDRDTNGADDVFVRTRTALTRVSVAADGAQADGPSQEPDISENGRFVAFSSAATNLAPGDDNGRSDVFVKDRLTGSVQLVSKAADGDSRAPAISADGRFVSFWSDATDLVAGDRNGVGDVFLADLRRGTVRLVSRSTRGRQQNTSVTPPFVQVSDVSRFGRFVAFDSDATNLVERDVNQSTDVFVRDVKRGTTGRASVDERLRQGDNDSFYPTISANGRYVAYESFANNLSRHDGSGEDLFVFDLGNQSNVLIDVGSFGARKRRESIRQLLQRPAIANSGKRAAFSSTSGNLARGDDNSHQDVFARILTPPRARVTMAEVVGQRARYTVRGDDPAAKDFRCRVDGAYTRCGRLPLLRPGRHDLRVYAGGAGMLFQPRATLRRFTVR
jgi:Tol biopolymer transport system component